MDEPIDNKYQLPFKEHEKIRQRIARRELAGSEKRNKPRAIVLAGQPGSGKCGLRIAAENELRRSGSAVVVDTDELRGDYTNRKLRTDYKKLSIEDDRSAAGLVQEDAGKWADELTEDAIAHGRNVIIDGTLKNKENAEKLFKDLKQGGYDIDLRVLAVAKADSMQSVYARYEGPKATKGKPGRWVPEKVHDEAYTGLVESLRLIEHKGYADQTLVYKRGVDRDSPPVLVHTGRGAAEALEKVRKRERTPQELAARDALWNREAKSPKDPDAGIIQRIRARDPELSEPQNRHAAELAAQARDKARSATTKEGATLWTKHSTSTKESAGPWTKHSTSTKEAAGPWVKHSSSGKETGSPWVKHSTSTNKAAEPQAKHSKSSPQQKAGPKSPGKGR